MFSIIHFFLETTAAPLVPSGEDVTTTYSGAWTATSAKFSRGLSESAQHFYYEAIEVSVSMEGVYTFTGRSQINTYAYLYDEKFDSNNPTLNLITQYEDSVGKEQFKFTALLHPDHLYVLVATTSNPETTGEFSIISSGPAAVNIHSKIESRSMTEGKIREKNYIVTAYRLQEFFATVSCLLGNIHRPALPFLLKLKLDASASKFFPIFLRDPPLTEPLVVTVRFSSYSYKQ